MKFSAPGGSPRRLALAVIATATAAAVAAPIAMSDTTQGPPDKTWSKVEKSATYYGVSDLVTSCPGATPGKGLGGGCFPAVAGATYVTASLTDSVSSEVPGSITFQGSGGATSTKSVTDYFCGKSDYIKVPAGTVTIFVSALSPVGDAAYGPKCATTDTGTTGTATLDSYTPPPPTTGSTGGSTGTTTTTSTPSPTPAPAARVLRTARGLHRATSRHAARRAAHRA